MSRRAPVALAATLTCLALLGGEASTAHEVDRAAAMPVAVADPVAGAPAENGGSPTASAAPDVSGAGAAGTGPVRAADEDGAPRWQAPPTTATEVGQRRAERRENGRRRRRYRRDANGRWWGRDRDEPTTPGTGGGPGTSTTTTWWPTDPTDPTGTTTTTTRPEASTTTTTTAPGAPTSTTSRAVPPVSGPPASRPPVTTPDSSPGDRWRPAQGEAWQIQLSTPVDLGVDAPIYEIDGELNDASVVAALHAAGRRAICYVDVGAAETYRSDYGAIPAVALGNVVDGWPDERWLDIRRIDLLAPVITQRLQMCKDKGFDAVDPDMIEGYADPASGFPLTYADQLRYNRWIADEVHARGMSVALKQDIDQVADLEPWFDFAVNEECAHYDECEAYRPFLAAGKAVFEIEYDVPTSRFCAPARALGIHAQRKRLSLDAWRETC